MTETPAGASDTTVNGVFEVLDEDDPNDLLLCLDTSYWGEIEIPFTTEQASEAVNALTEEVADDEDLVTGGGEEVAPESSQEEATAPFWCPWCEAVIVIEGELTTTEDEAYWHAYDHREKGRYAVHVQEAFERLDTVVTEQHKVTPTDGGEDGE